MKTFSLIFLALSIFLASCHDGVQAPPSETMDKSGVTIANEANKLIWGLPEVRAYFRMMDSMYDVEKVHACFISTLDSCEGRPCYFVRIGREDPDRFYPVYTYRIYQSDLSMYKLDVETGTFNRIQPAPVEKRTEGSADNLLYSDKSKKHRSK